MSIGTSTGSSRSSRVLRIAPSTYYQHAARRAGRCRLPARVERDARLCEEIRRVWEENFRVYGVRKVWLQLNREGFEVARCTDRKSTRLNSSHVRISYAVFCLKK